MQDLLGIYSSFEVKTLPLLKKRKKEKKKISKISPQNKISMRIFQLCQKYRYNYINKKS